MVVAVSVQSKCGTTTCIESTCLMRSHLAKTKHAHWTRTNITERKCSAVHGGEPSEENIRRTLLFHVAMCTPDS